MHEPNLVDKYFDRCFVNNQILYENEKINYFYKEETVEKGDSEFNDSGWRFFVGNESQEFMDEASNFSYVSLGAVLTKDDSVIDFLDSPITTELIRMKDGKFEKPK